MTLEEIKRLDAGLEERVPTFEEVLEVTDLPIYAELKVVEAARPLTACIREGGSLEESYLSPFSPRLCTE